VDARWSGFRLSLLGRADVVKQVLAAMVTYHATFIPVPQDLLQRLCRAIHTFIAANRPLTPGAAAALFLGKEVCYRAAADGGIALVDIRAQILALQAKVVGRPTGARAAGLEDLLRPLAVQEHSLAGSAGTRHGVGAAAARLAAKQIPALFQLCSEAGGGPTARPVVPACLPAAAAPSPAKAGSNRLRAVMGEPLFFNW
jgi:hypothetical protein